MQISLYITQHTLAAKTKVSAWQEAHQGVQPAPLGADNPRDPEEAGCLKDESQTSECMMQICDSQETSLVEICDRNMMSDTLNKQSTHLQKMAPNEAWTAETKDQSVTYQDRVKGDLRLCV